MNLCIFYPLAINDSYTKIPDRFQTSVEWAWVARSFRHSSLSTAYKQAIETLERGRGPLWSEMRGLRTSLHQLQADDSFGCEDCGRQSRSRGIDNVRDSERLDE